MSSIQQGTCSAPGPYEAHCSEDVTHRYSCYDAGEDVSFNARQDFEHKCEDSLCLNKHFNNEGD